MYLDRLNIMNFKNIAEANIEFSHSINALVGLNGAGKTNIIEAVYYLSMCKSSMGQSDRGSVRHESDFFVLEGDYTDGRERHNSVTCTYTSKGGKKILKFNGKEYDKLSEHVGRIPVVIVSPADAFLVSDAADERRRYLNAFISQLDSQYLSAIIRYNSVLAERNKLLKNPSSNIVNELLETYDMQLIAHGEVVNAKRKEYIEMLIPSLEKYYRILCDDREEVSLSYASELNDTSFEELLARSRQRDTICQFTTTGVHRDDMVMRIGGMPLKKYGSQGQQKSFLVALKLAQYDIVSRITGEKPILLLDDVFDKLDAGRVARLIEIVNSEEFGQIFISDCNRRRLVDILDKAGRNYSVCHVDNGCVTPTSSENL
ncbi:MAG: DNA replication/repair protein RecF [Rikenellaceae bacterium]|nr:DNA replication/repair protein RecF [Rikenellaceae bacterium]